MTNRFMLSVDNATAQQQDAITTWLRSTQLGFWHYLSHAWLVVDRTDTYNVNSLRDQVTRLVPGATFIIVVVADPNGWAGYGPSPKFEWLHSVWMKP